MCLAAGLEGIREKIMPPESINRNIFELSEEERKALNIDVLPTNLMHALQELKKDKFICDVLGEHICSKYIEAKEKEWDRYKASVTDWEIQAYLGKY